MAIIGTFYNSEMSHSSVVASYRPEGPGHKPRRASSTSARSAIPRRGSPAASARSLLFSLDLPARPAASDADRLG